MLLTSLILAAVIASPADVPRLSAQEVHALIQNGDAVVIDVRGSVPFKYGRVAGAISMPLGAIARRFDELPQDRTIVAYCTCKSEESSLEAALQLAQKHGFENVAVLVGGLAAWKDAGFAIEADRATDAPLPSQPATTSATSGRLAPPAGFRCDRNDLTSHAGRVIGYERDGDSVTVRLATSAGTVASVTATSFLLDGQPLADPLRIETADGRPSASMSAIAWICGSGQALIDWRPGVTFNGAE